MCVCYYRNTTSQQYTPPPLPLHTNKIHPVQTISLTHENKCKKFTIWSQLAQYSTTQNQRHFNHKQKNCSIYAKMLLIIQKLIFLFELSYYIAWTTENQSMHRTLPQKVIQVPQATDEEYKPHNSTWVLSSFYPSSTTSSFFETLLLSMQTVFPCPTA